MNWKVKPKSKNGEYRWFFKFAMFPVRIADTIVWLEKYLVIQRHVVVNDNLCGWVTVTKLTVNEFHAMSKDGIKSQDELLQRLAEARDEIRCG